MSRSKLTREADRVFSLYIRSRGSEGGYNNCFTCGVHRPIEEMQAAHFRPRRYLHTRWHPVNVWVSCGRCNVELNGNLKVYESRLRKAFGDEAIDDLFRLSRDTAKFQTYEIQEVIDTYRNHPLV